MELNLHPLAKACSATGRVFAEGDAVICYLVREATGEVCRRDILASTNTDPRHLREVLCSWTLKYKARHDQDNLGRALKLTAENLFMTLADAAAEQSPENLSMLQFLALLLERKKILRTRGLTPDGSRQIVEHIKTHQFYEVPVGRFDEDFFLKIQSRLSFLVTPASAEGATASAKP